MTGRPTFITEKRVNPDQFGNVVRGDHRVVVVATLNGLTLDEIESLATHPATEEVVGIPTATDWSAKATFRDYQTAHRVLGETGVSA